MCNHSGICRYTDFWYTVQYASIQSSGTSTSPFEIVGASMIINLEENNSLKRSHHLSAKICSRGASFSTDRCCFPKCASDPETLEYHFRYASISSIHPALLASPSGLLYTHTQTRLTHRTFSLVSDFSSCTTFSNFLQLDKNVDIAEGIPVVYLFAVRVGNFLYGSY